MIQYIDSSAGRTEEFVQATQAVEDYLEKLPLTEEQHDRLVDLLVTNIIEAEKGAFLYAVRIAGTAAGAAASEGREIRESDFMEAIESAEKR